MDGDQIIEQMRQVRRELGDDVQGIVDSARVMTDWRHYYRRYPWAFLGAAAAAGFLIVPRRFHIIQPDPATLAELVKSQQLVVKAQQEPVPQHSLLASLATLLGAALVQGALAIGRQYLDSYLTARRSAPGERTMFDGEVCQP